LRSGEKEQVAQATFEHYLPRFSGDELPGSLPGVITGMADRLDSLVGLFAASLAPSGNKDPFGQRRAALGLVQVLTGLDLVFDLRAAIQSAAKYQPVPVDAGVMKMVGEFITERLRNFLMESGGRYDIVDGVLAAQWYNPAGANQAIKALGEWVSRPDWHTILPAYARCVRITRPVGEVYEVQENIFIDAAEKELWEALRRAEQTPRAPGSVDDFLNAFLPMIPAIDRFFEIVLVMTEEERLRQNRLGLLQRIARLADGVADLSKLEGF
jgi:glycyl-tRNA synthetase